VLRDGALVAGDGGGGVVLFREIGITRPLGRFLGACRLSPLVDALDKVLARHRPLLGRFVPDGAAPRRYP
jgi:hypothetical protein